MKAPAKNGRAHSADVRIELRLNGFVIPIDQLGPDFFISRHVVDHPPAVGEMRLSIDGQERRWSVNLTDGMSAHREETRIATV